MSKQVKMKQAKWYETSKVIWDKLATENEVADKLSKSEDNWTQAEDEQLIKSQL